MFSSNRNLLVIINNGSLDEASIRQQAACLQRMLYAENADTRFCQAHELVNRNRITSRPHKILREARYRQLRPFRFLINKN